MTAFTTHCQICARAIKAKSGKIAHHGYLRRDGWQTSSCPGARHQPYEVARDRLGLYITNVTAQLERIAQLRSNIEGELAPATFTYTRRLGYDRRETVRLDVTRATFDAEYAEHPALMKYGMYTFDHVKRQQLTVLLREIESLTLELDHQQHRYDVWKAPEVAA